MQAQRLCLHEQSFIWKKKWVLSLCTMSYEYSYMRICIWVQPVVVLIYLVSFTCSSSFSFSIYLIFFFVLVPSLICLSISFCYCCIVCVLSSHSSFIRILHKQSINIYKLVTLLALTVFTDILTYLPQY